MSERPKPQDHKEALKSQLDEFIGTNEAIATGMLGIGVRLGWDDEGQQRFEVILFSDTLEQSQLDELRAGGLPDNFNGHGVNYEIIRNVEFQQEQAEEETPWWRDLPAD